MLYFIIGVIAVLLLVIVVQANRKATYAKCVYQEFEKNPDGKQLSYIIKNNPSEKIRLDLSMMQLEILKRCYKDNVAPSDTAFAMVGALDEMLKLHYKNS